MTFWHWLKPRLGPSLLIAAGLVLLAWLGTRAAEPTPPTATEYGVVVLLSSALNIAGGASFARIGRVEPTHARSAVRRLLGIGMDLAVSQQLWRDEDPDSRRDALLASMSGRLSSAIQDWEDVHPDALQEVLDQAHATEPRGGEIYE